MCDYIPLDCSNKARTVDKEEARTIIQIETISSQIMCKSVNDDTEFLK